MPAFSFSCPQCGKAYENVKASLQGRKVSCTCGRVFRLGPKTEQQIARDAKLAADAAEKKRLAQAKAARLNAEKERKAAEKAAMAQAQKEREEKLKAAKEKLELEKSEAKWKSNDELASLMHVETLEPQNDLAFADQDEFEINDTDDSIAVAAVKAPAEDSVDDLIANLSEDSGAKQESSGEFDLSDDPDDDLLKGLIDEEEPVVAAIAADEEDDLIRAVAVVADEPVMAAAVVEDAVQAVPVEEEVIPAVPVTEAKQVSDLLPGPPTDLVAAIPVGPEPEQVVAAVPAQPVEEEVVAAIPVAPATSVPKASSKAVRAKSVDGTKPINLAPFVETPAERAEFE